ncbi:LytR/AlgR family response regulator transcription factor [Sphingomonas quercus]|uniref:LytTR family DNA-binding domain-containing protein n=1 Tax=Sphingomonas quercus TaxID=2842451 RepID=A0ABS6BIT9_9SPHN|nr:LytTR family DNA-binding domain-containing protein [Sphingomonas quercus]MBU3077346.1 LytTR family DNA-binding domain-containing protein [Sphingomonas quercus]
MSELSILVADDEPLAIRRLRFLIERYEGVRLITTARDGDEALVAIRAQRPDVVLLDVEMPGLGGFEVVERLESDEQPIIIFVTAFDHYAGRAFDARAVDYLVKPVEASRLYTALDRAREHRDRAEAATRLEEMREIIANLRRNAAPVPQPRYEREIWVRSTTETVRVPLDAVDLIEAERDYVRLRIGTRTVLYREPLSSLEKRLDPEVFIRVHRSVIVRRDCVVAISRSASRAPVLRLRAGDRISVGRSYAARIAALRT